MHGKRVKDACIFGPKTHIGETEKSNKVIVPGPHEMRSECTAFCGLHFQHEKNVITLCTKLSMHCTQNNGQAKIYCYRNPRWDVITQTPDLQCTTSFNTGAHDPTGFWVKWILNAVSKILKSEHLIIVIRLMEIKKWIAFRKKCCAFLNSKMYSRAVKWLKIELM